VNAPMKTTPSAHEAEVSVLACLLIDPKAIEHVEPAHFLAPQHRAIAEAARELHDAREPIDLVSLGARLTARGEMDLVGGYGGISSMAVSVVSAANVEHYAGLVAEAHRRREIIAAAERAIAGAQTPETPVAEVIAAQESALTEIRPKAKGRGLRPLQEGVTGAFARVERLAEHRSALTGWTTGLDALDDLTAGLQAQDLVVVAGRPSMGKTAEAVGMVFAAAEKQGAHVAIFSLEMGAEALALRLIGSEGRIEGARLRVGCLRDEDWPKVARAASTLSEAPVWIDDSGGVTLGYIRAELARHVEQHGPVNLVLVDYLQLMSHDNPRLSPEQVVTENCKGLKQLAKEHNATVIVLSQLNRALEQRQDKRPIMSDLKQSSGIEQDADVIIFIYRDVVYNPETDKPKHAELIIGKQRNGALGTAHVAFLGEYTRFENLAPEDAGGFARE